jgi:hypothetical protein
MRKQEIFLSILLFCLTKNSLAKIEFSLNLSSDFPNSTISIFENLEKDFSTDRSFDFYNDSFGILSSYRSFLNSPIYKTHQLLLSVPQRDLEGFFRRQPAILYLSDIQWCLYLYLHNYISQSDSLNKYLVLYQTVSRLLNITRSLNKFHEYDNDRIKYSSDGLIIEIDTFSITYEFDRVVSIGNATIQYSADKVVKIDGLKISYDSEKIVAIGHLRDLAKPLPNRNYRNLTYFERKEYLQRQRTIPGFISLHNVLRLYIENRKLEGKDVPVRYLQLYSIIKRAIAASIGYRCQQTIGGKNVTCLFGRIDSIGKYRFDYFFDNIQSINDFKIEYFFGKISKAGDLKVKWQNNRIIRINDQKILSDKDLR